MLTHLTIENFILIEKAEIEFQSGMTIITGETGAGKSIILDAIQLVSGGRAESHFVRKEMKKCEITAIFDIQNYSVIQQWLAEKNIVPDQECFLRRAVTADGRSRSFINNQAVPLQILRELGFLLVNLHGQHEYHALLTRDTPRECLDAYGHHESLLKSIKRLHKDYSDVEAELKKHQKRFENRETQTAFLRYQIEEFSALDIIPENLQSLEADYKSLSQMKDNSENYQAVLNILDNTILPDLQKAHSLSFSLKNVTELLESARIQLEEAADEIKHITENENLDPGYLTDLENKLTRIYDIARKHRIKPEKLGALFDQLKAELNTLETIDDTVNRLEKLLDTLKKEYLTLSHTLTAQRIKASQAMSREIVETLQTLNMKGVQFSIQLTPHDENSVNPYGAEKIEFLVSANPGQPLHSISKVASGGELSRISLAVDLIAAKNQSLPTLIFDEVDAGIGGGTAAKVGQLLKQLSQKAQVICITHQAQIAAFGKHHIQVEKSIQNNNTYTRIEYLNTKEKIHEIARMLGGIEITDQALSHAKALVEAE
jgi:DNA repair protein RecN (Recombination protein N)